MSIYIIEQIKLYSIIHVIVVINLYTFIGYLIEVTFIDIVMAYLPF